jgi:hypothetical protein
MHPMHHYCISSPPSYTHIHRTTLEAEGRLKALRAAEGPEEAMQPLIAEIRSNYQTIITTSPTLCRTKDVNAQLWKMCFYLDIEKFRLSIKQTVALCDSREPKDVPQKQKAQEKLIKLMTDFKAFLGKTSAFYNNLLLQLETRMQECKAKSSWSSDPSYQDLCFSAHRSLLYLGDISRYWEMHAESKQRDWKIAEKCYLRALRFMPTSGHAHNQLAVTAIYGDADLTAFFHYCLSIQIKDSFQTGIPNLILFFKKNKKFVRSMEDGPVSGQEATPRELKKILKSCLSKFMRLHGILFEASVRHIESARASASPDGEGDGVIAKNKELDEISLVEFGEFLPSVLDRLTHLIVHGQMSEGMLLKMIAVSIFSVHRYVFEQPPAAESSAGAEGTSGSSPADGDMHTNNPRSTAGSYALVLLFSFINRLSLLGDRYRKLVPLILTPLVAFSEWVIQWRLALLQAPLPSALLPDPSSQGRKSSKRTRDASGACGCTGVWSLPASAETLQLENRSRSGMRTSLVSFVNMLDPNGTVTSALLSPAKVPSSTAGALATSQPSPGAPAASEGPLYNTGLSCLMSTPLREFIELRGFSPVAERIEGYYSRYFFKDFKEQSSLDAVKAKNVRLFLLRQFVDKVLLISPLMTLQIPASMGDVTTAAKTKNLTQPNEPGGGRRYPPGSSSAPASASRSRRGAERSAPLTGPMDAAGMANKRARSSPSKGVLVEYPSRSSRERERRGKRREPYAVSADVENVQACRRGGVAASTSASDAQSRSRRRRSGEEEVAQPGEGGDAEESSEEEEEGSGNECDEDNNGEQSDTQLEEEEEEEEVVGGGGGVADQGRDDAQGLSEDAAEEDDDDDDDDDDEIIVFKPTFSRYVEHPVACDVRPAARAEPEQSGLGGVGTASSSAVAPDIGLDAAATAAATAAPTAAPTAPAATPAAAPAPVYSDWLGAVKSPTGSQDVSSALSWSLFGGNNFTSEQDCEGEKIMESLRLGNTSPGGTEEQDDDDAGIYGGLMRPSMSDPCLWAAVGDNHTRGGGIGGAAADSSGLFAPSSDRLGWFGNQPSSRGAGFLGDKGLTSGPPPGFEDSAMEPSPADRSARFGHSSGPPGLEKLPTDTSGDAWFAGLRR